MKRKSIVCLILVTAMVLAVQLNAIGAETKQPVDVVIMTTPFGTPMYNIGAAMEQVFKKAGSWVRIKHQETPGAMYQLKYFLTNRQKMISGEMPYALSVGGALTLDFVAEGRPPLDKLAFPSYRARALAPRARSPGHLASWSSSRGPLHLCRRRFGGSCARRSRSARLDERPGTA